MKRRNFLKKIPLAASVPFAISGVPINLIAKSSYFRQMAASSTNDRVIVILQLLGGNDGVNTIIPVEQYDQYYSRRANIAIPANNGARRYIPLDGTLASADQVGLHPDMLGVKELYDRGKMAIVQGVSYKNNNGSHFRGRDIWNMGGGVDDFYSSGWVGRYLQSNYAPQVYPDDFPNTEMPDPLAIELGSDVSLVFHQQGNIPSSISLGGNPASFADLIENLDGFVDQGSDPRGRPPEYLLNSPYWNEMNWILGLEDKSEDYAARLLEIYNNASATSVTYPEVYPFNAPNGSKRNRLTPQLQLVARLLDGGGPGLGAKTKVFLVKIGGFDTHADQVENYDPTMGNHASLLYHISSAMKAFQDDLRARGIEDRVLTVTMSEFGRRIASNGSYGTDHGTGGPMLIFGKGANPGVYGTNPDMSANNVGMQFDYRQIYASILEDWMQVDKSVITNDIFFNNYIDGTDDDGQSLVKAEVSKSVITGVEDFITHRFHLKECYPNPAIKETKIGFYLNTPAQVSLSLYDKKGRLVQKILQEMKEAGEHEAILDVSDLSPGVYIYRINAGLLKDSKKLIVKN
ncbi:MAG: DUF1501 domain-containing protein [Reichenbachiella sp.]|uniref:DUF1501 domain-containing protein n=1 Tax=Reichenbachiella sp. TaxID=2184521 RepID=UPI0032670CE5